VRSLRSTSLSLRCYETGESTPAVLGRGVAKWLKGAGVGDENHVDERSSTTRDPSASRFGLRRLVARNRGLEVAYRVVVAVLGFAIIAAGLALIPLPGPGWLIVFAGLALLSTEFAWADRLLRYARTKVQGWTTWATRQSLVVRGLLGLVGLGFVAGVVTLYVKVVGVPSWLPLIG
jgi:uncharacterized protein (TIGR02611 family)